MTDEYTIIVLGTFSFSLIGLMLIMLCFLLHFSCYQHLCRHIALESNSHGTQAVTYVPGGASAISEYDEAKIAKDTLV